MICRRNCRIIPRCRRRLIDGRVLHLDATMIRADIDKDRAEQPGCSDPEARFGRKKGAPGYKQQTVADGKARVVVAVDVMPANAHDHQGAVETVDQAMARIGQRPEAVCADSAYANGPNAAAMEARDVRRVSPPRRIDRTGKSARQFTTEDFAYDTAGDVYVCPAN